MLAIASAILYPPISTAIIEDETILGAKKLLFNIGIIYLVKKSEIIGVIESIPSIDKANDPILLIPLSIPLLNLSFPPNT